MTASDRVFTYYSHHKHLHHLKRSTMRREDGRSAHNLKVQTEYLWTLSPWARTVYFSIYTHLWNICLILQDLPTRLCFLFSSSFTAEHALMGQGTETPMVPSFSSQRKLLSSLSIIGLYKTVILWVPTYFNAPYSSEDIARPKKNPLRHGETKYRRRTWMFQKRYYPWALETHNETFHVSKSI